MQLKLVCSLVGFTIFSMSLCAQKTIKEFVEKTDREKIKKMVTMNPGDYPATAGGFGDGHGRNPLLLKKEQIPDTVALITFYVYDLGTTTVSKTGNAVYTTYNWISATGGNLLANDIYAQAIADLKAAFKAKGAVLLTPEEFLNTEQKRKYYYNNFKPEISNLGNFLSGLENKGVDMEAAANSFRTLDIAASTDYLRSQSLGSDLASNLGVKGVLSVAVQLQSGSKYIDFHGIKMSINGPNPIPKEDKKYVAQKMGNGYYDGQLYAHSTMFMKGPIRVGEFEKKSLTETRFEGIASLMSAMIEEMYDTMNDSVEKAAKKYSK